jgi:hypothetical protein
MQELVTQMDRRLVKTQMALLLVIVVHRHRIQGLLVSELAGVLLGGGHAPAGAKRISNLLRSAKWNAQLVADYFWQRADQAIDQRLNPSDDVYVIWDESAIEKPESLKSGEPCAVRSSKASRLKRIKSGYYNRPGGKPIFVPGLNRCRYPERRCALKKACLRFTRSSLYHAPKPDPVRHQEPEIQRKRFVQSGR